MLPSSPRTPLIFIGHRGTSQHLSLLPKAGLVSALLQRSHLSKGLFVATHRTILGNARANSGRLLSPPLPRAALLGGAARLPLHDRVQGRACHIETIKNQCPYRLVVRTSRCGRDNAGSTPGEDVYPKTHPSPSCVALQIMKHMHSM